MMPKMYDRPYIVGGGASSSGALQMGHCTDTKEQCDRCVDLDKISGLLSAKWSLSGIRTPKRTAF